MNNEYLLHKNFTITPGDADFNQRLRISSLINLYIHSASLHATELGLGYIHLGELGMGWFLSRFKISINNLPEWPGELSIQTWPKGLDRLYYIRDAEFYDSENIKFASLTSGWMMIDKKTKRPKLHEVQRESLYYNQHKHAVIETIPTLKSGDKPDLSVEYKVRYTDIDMNHHLTTIRYIDFMFDTYDIDFISRLQNFEFTVNFIKEIPFNSDIIMHRYDNSSSHLFELINKSNDTICFRGELIWGK